jgi:glucose/arabinose dehydrogenase
MLVACSDTPEQAQPEPSAAAPSEPEPAENDSRPKLEGIELELVAEGFAAPLFLTHPGDDDARLYVVEQGGLIRVLEDGEVLDEPFLDVSDDITAGGEQGLLGLAFHPEFADNGRFFVNFTDTGGDTNVVEYRADPGADQAGAEPVQTLLTVEQPFANHNGGHLDFGPDGFLYISLGDGGGAGDPQGNGQNPDTLLGSLLRIDVDSGGADGYGIPTDNPFADSGGAPEAWAIGLRNPWRFSFDRRADTLWIGDVGQSELEEINRVPADEAGVNYGWNLLEGSACYQPNTGCDRSGKEEPVTEYRHDQGCSVTGGYVYRGTEQPTLQGNYFFGDFCSGMIWAVPADADKGTEPRPLLDTDLSISSFGQDANGELYVIDLTGGTIHRVVAT